MAHALPSTDVVRISPNPSLTGLYDVSLENMDFLKTFSSVECHIILYPYSRKVSSQNITFLPFEEYVKDISSHQRSVYYELGSQFSEKFGIILGLLIALIFFKLKPDDLFSVQSIISILGAYFIGKDLWDDIERLLVDLTKKWRLRYQQRYYFYQLERSTTITAYSNLARERRFGSRAIYPEKIDMIQHSNSKTIRLFFDMSDFRKFDAPSAHILSIQLDQTIVEAQKQDGFMLGVKLSLNSTRFGFTRCRELFQTIDGNRKGCLDLSENWHDNAIFFRNTFCLDRLKYFHDHGVKQDKSFVSIAEE